jgi:hypothetical protein
MLDPPPHFFFFFFFLVDVCLRLLLFFFFLSFLYIYSKLFLSLRSLRRLDNMWLQMFILSSVTWLPSLSVPIHSDIPAGIPPSLTLEGVCGGIVCVADWEHAEEFAQWVIIEMVDYEFIA